MPAATAIRQPQPRTSSRPAPGRRRYPELRAVVFDLPGTQALAQELIAATDVAGCLELRAGDFFTDRLPDADLYALGRIVHDWSEPRIRQLLHKVYEQLPAGG